jgi:recyclin-1
MRDMVYDDAIWIQRLKSMSCWNESEARARANINGGEDKRASMGLKNQMNGLKPSIETPSRNSLQSPTRHSGHFSETSVEGDSRPGSGDDFDLAPLSLSPRPSTPGVVDSTTLLQTLSNVQSIRGQARDEYGKVYVALRPYYKDAVRTKHAANAKIFRTYRDPNQQAQMLSQIMRFAQSDTSSGRAQRDERLDIMVAAFEDAVAKEYEQGLKIGDVDGRMKKYAGVLVTLNGGKRAVDEFISQNPLLRTKSKLGDPMDCFSATSSDHFFPGEVNSFFRYLTSAYNEQVGIIARVFPPSVNVAEPFLRRIGEEVLKPYLDTLFDTAHSKSTESYLNAVSGTYDQCILLFETLEPPLPREVFDHSLDNIILDLYNDRFTTYLELEQSFFKRRSDAEVNGWERQLTQQDSSIELMYMANVNRQADKRDFMSSFKKVVMMPVNALPAFPFGAKPPKEPSEKLGSPSLGISSTPDLPSDTPRRVPSPFLDPPTTELAAKAAIMKSRLEGIKGLFSLEVALSLVHMAKSSLERTAAFTKRQTKFLADAKSQCEVIFITLLKTLGNHHVRTGFDKAVAHLSDYNPRAITDRDGENSHGVAPLATFLELVNVGDLIQQMLDVFFEQELVANKLTDRNDFLSPVLKEKKRFEQMLDERVAAGLNKGIEVLMAEVEYIASTTMNAEDYNPGAAGNVPKEVVDIGPSKTAVLIVDVVGAHTKMLVGSTDKNMLDVFNQEVGLRLFQTVCKHLKRQRISVDGSIRLISDTNHYYAFIQTLKNKDILQYFKALRELAQIYLVDPKNAKELAAIIADTDRYLGIFRPEEVYEFAERRADWYQVKTKVEKAMYGMECTVM